MLLHGYTMYSLVCCFDLMPYVHAQDNAWIELTNTCLQNGSCSLNIYETLNIRQDVINNDAQTLVQDLFLASTFFIGTLAAIGFIVSGMLMIFGGASESMYEQGKKWFKYSIIGILLVVFSYSLIRLVEYIAQWRT